MSTWTVREKVVDARTSAVSGTAVVDTITELQGHNLDEFSELLIYLDVNTALAGSTPTMELYLQKAVVVDPDPTNDSHWDDIFAFLKAETATLEYMVSLPWLAAQLDKSVAIAGDTRSMATLTEKEAKIGSWGDRIRIVEKMGGTVTTQAVYDITITGQLRVVN